MTTRSLAEIYAALCKTGTCSDKGTTHSYVDVYEELLAPYRSIRARVLEIGVQYGYSLRLWQEYFDDGFVWGVDIAPVLGGVPGLILGDATHELGLPWGWDIIIDDGSHRVHDQAATYQLLYPRLAPGGLYVIEDVQSDADCEKLLTVAPFEVIDLRNVKGRYDDVMLVARS